LVKSLEIDRTCPGIDNFAQAGGWGFISHQKILENSGFWDRP